MDDAPRILDLDTKTKEEMRPIPRSNELEEEYYRGKVDGLSELAGGKCRECGHGYSIDREEKGEPWFHMVDDKKKECEAQSEHNHIHRALSDAHQAYLTTRYGRMWHTSYRVGNYHSYELLKDKCYCCHRKATQRIDSNCWGVVGEYDVCDEHAERYDGRNVETVEKRE